MIKEEITDAVKVKCFDRVHDLLCDEAGADKIMECIQYYTDVYEEILDALDKIEQKELPF